MSLEGMLPIELIERRTEIEKLIELDVRTVNAYEQAPALIDAEKQETINVLNDGILRLNAEYKELTGEYYHVPRR